MDDAPSSPVIHKVRLFCFFSSINANVSMQHHLAASTACGTASVTLVSVSLVQSEEECDNAAHTL